MGEIEKALQKATKVTRKGKEPLQEYLARLATADIDDDTWEGLMQVPGAQEWVNAATKAHTAEKEIPGFPDVEVEDGEVAAKKAGAKTGTDNKAKAAEKKPAEKKAAAAEPKVRSAVPLKEDGIKFRIKRMILKDPKISAESLVGALGKGGAKVSKVTVSAVRAEFRHTLKVLNNEGITKIDL